MGERKGQNKYYPPDFDYKKHGSLSGYHNEHPLRERARKLKSQGILIIRFEMPYNIWCEGCKNPIGMGVRYNAEKSKIGNYYTTPIYKFRMKCHLCDNHFEIKTDPAAHDYVITSGARRKEQRWDPKENEQVVPEDRDTHKKLVTDAMYKLEHSSEDSAKLKRVAPTIGTIEERQSQWKDDYLLNKLARAKFREEKTHIKQAAAVDSDLLQRASLDMKLVPENNDDIVTAQLLQHTTLQRMSEEDKRRAVENRPLFRSTSATITSPQSNNATHTSESSDSTNPEDRIKQARARLGLDQRVMMTSKTQGFSLTPRKRKTKSLTGTDLGIRLKRTCSSDIGQEKNSNNCFLVQENETIDNAVSNTDNQMKNMPDSVNLTDAVQKIELPGEPIGTEKSISGDVIVPNNQSLNSNVTVPRPSLNNDVVNSNTTVPSQSLSSIVVSPSQSLNSVLCNYTDSESSDQD